MVMNISEFPNEYLDEYENDNKIDFDEELNEIQKYDEDNLKEIENNENNENAKNKTNISEEKREFYSQIEQSELKKTWDSKLYNLLRDHSKSSEDIIHLILNLKKQSDIIDINFTNDSLSCKEMTQISQESFEKKKNLNENPTALSASLELNNQEVKESIRDDSKLLDKAAKLQRNDNFKEFLIERNEINTKFYKNNEYKNLDEILEFHYKDIKKEDKEEFIIGLLKLILLKVALQNPQDNQFFNKILKIINKRN